MNESQYFICTKECRISDLNLNLREKQVFEKDSMTIQSSRGVRAAKNSNWIREITKKEFDEIQAKKEIKEEVSVPVSPSVVKGA